MTESPVTGVPVCYRHPSRETYVRCARCDRPICPSCMHEASVGHQCPECVAEGRRTQRRAVTAFGGGPAGERGNVTYVLIALNVLTALAAYASAQATGALGGMGIGGLFSSDTPLHAWGALLGGWPAPPAQPEIGVATGEYYRMFTSMFLHAGPFHLLLNMFALYMLGRPLEAALGPARFLALYLVSGLGGSVAVYLFSPATATVGASGAIFGLFGALILVVRRMRGSVASVIPILVINLILTFGVPGISIAAHLGGLATGALIGASLVYAPRANRTLVQSGVIAGTVVLLTALIVVQTMALTAAA